MGGSPKINMPTPPSYSSSMEEILRSQLKYAPEIYAAEKQYQPLYQALQAQQERQAAEGQMALMKDLQPKLSELEDAYYTQQGLDQTRRLQEQAPAYVQAFQEAAGTADITKGLKSYAAELQAQGPQYDISPEEQRAIDQSVRSAYAARGTALGDQAALGEVLNRYQFQRQRRLEEDQLRSARQIESANIAAGLQQQSAPAMQAFYGQPMYAGNFAGNTIQSALMGQSQAGAQYFNPESPTGMGAIYGGYNTRVQGLIGNAQAGAASRAGAMQMGGAIGGAALIGGAIIF
jgi:hypothetical protein